MFVAVCLIGVSKAGVLLPAARFAAAPVAALAPAVPAVAAVNTNYDPLPQYTYAYNVQDALTGDNKSQQETRDGDVVKGKSFQRCKLAELFAPVWQKFHLTKTYVLFS